MKLQKDIDRLGSWARKWGMKFQPVTCNMMQLTNKKLTHKIQAGVGFRLLQFLMFAYFLLFLHP